MKLKKQIKLELYDYLFLENSKDNRDKIVNTLNELESGFIFKDITDDELINENFTVFFGLNKITNKIILVSISTNNKIKIYK